MFLQHYKFSLAPVCIFYLILPLYFSSFPLQMIPVNNEQIYTITSNSLFEFEIINMLPSVIGTFHISVSQINEETSFPLIINSQRCSNRLITGEFLFNKNYSEIFVTTNSSNNHCFQLGFLSDIHPVSASFSIIAEFTQIDTILTLDQPLSFNLYQGIQKEFALDFTGESIEILLITVKNKTKEAFNLELIEFDSLCIGTKTNNSWLCYLRKKEIIKFSLLNHASAGSYDIVASQVQPEKVGSTFKTRINPMISGFGTLLTVDLPFVGILKIKAISENNKLLKIWEADSLLKLFSILSQNKAKSTFSNSQSQAEILVQNKKINSQRYYLIQEANASNFLIQSDFIKQDSLEIGTQGSFYIDPVVYQYRHIKIDLAKTGSFQKYTIKLIAMQPKSPMNLYYEFNSYNNDEPVFPNQYSFPKQAFIAPKVLDEFELSFITRPEDKVVYITIYALKQGFYKIQVIEIEHQIPLGGFLSIPVLGCIFILYCLVKILRGKGSNRYEIIDSNMDRNLDERNTTIPSYPLEPEPSAINYFLQIVVSDNHVLSSDSLNNQRETKERVQLSQKSEKGNTYKHNSYEDLKTKTLQEDIKNSLENEKRCDICFEKKDTLTFNPCLHSCACLLCSLIILQTSAKCPLCRSHIKGIKLNQFREI